MLVAALCLRLLMRLSRSKEDLKNVGAGWCSCERYDDKTGKIEKKQPRRSFNTRDASMLRYEDRSFQEVQCSSSSRRVLRTDFVEVIQILLGYTSKQPGTRGDNAYLGVRGNYSTPNALMISEH